MKKYNNNMFTMVPSSTGDASMRFNKRSRFSGGLNNNSVVSRYPHHNQASYQQHTQNINNVTENYQSSPNQFENSSRHFYGQDVPKRPPAPLAHNQAMQNKQLPPPPYTHNSGSAAGLSSSSASFSPTPPNTLKPPPQMQSTALKSNSTSSITTNKHQQQPQQPPQPLQHVAQSLLDSSSYYTYGYNSYYSPYSTEMMASAQASTFSMPDAMSPYMWQTITSTPPPKLPSQQLQPPLPPPPPLPQQQPPALPPLPSAEKPTPLQPPPPLPTLSVNTSLTTTGSGRNRPKDQDTGSQTIVKMKAKRKAMSTRYKLSKSWSEEDAALAIKAEEANVRKLQKDIILILRFPDPEISREIVKCYSPDIESVHFQLNFAPRYCLVHLKPGTNVEKTIETLSKIPFGNGFLSVEIKQIPHKAHTTKLNEIDPHTLYVGNLPTTIACKTLKDHFPGAARIDIGFAQRMKYTRYAFIRYKTVQQAIEAYKRMLDAEIGGRTLTIRFRRLTPANEGNKDGDTENVDVLDDVLHQYTLASEDNSTNSNTETEPSESFEDLERNRDKEPNDQPNKTGDLERSNVGEIHESNALQTDSRDSTLGTGMDAIETNSCNPHHLNETTEPLAVSSESTTTVVTQRATLFNIKPDPDIDPDDIVLPNDGVTTRFDINEDSIKQEKELATDFEFFAPANSQGCANKEKSTNNDTVSIHSATDETDTMSSMSAGSLGEFLQTCQRPRIISNDIDDIIGPPPIKRYKEYSDALNTEIKTEPPFEQQSTSVEENLSVQANIDIKRETTENDMNDVNNEIVQQHNNTNERVSRRREKSKHRQKNSNNNDDLVPPNALFLRGDVQNSLTSDPEICDNDEFFETRTKSSTQITTIKTEPIDDTNRNKRIVEDNKNSINSQQSEILSNNQTNNDMRNINRFQLQTTNATTLTNYEDDLVPVQNILCSRLNTQTDSIHETNQEQSFDIKLERENEDIFSRPCVTALRNDITNLNEDSNLSDLWNTNLLKQNASLESSNTKNNTDISKSYTSMDDDNDDDDIILVSDNISPQPKNSNSYSKSPLIIKESFSYKQTDLLTFTPKATATVTSLESCKLLPHHHHDNLDKLFEQLDSDSDSEL